MTGLKNAAHSDPNILARFWAKVAVAGPDDCWLWMASQRNKGYGAFAYTLDGRMIQDRAHRFCWVLHRGDIPTGLFVLHNCPAGDNPRCVNPAHLFLGTKADNNRDMRQKGRHVPGGTRCGAAGKWKRGQDHHGAKATPEMVVAIRAAYAAGGVSMTELARRYGIGQSQIHRIIRRKVWKHVA